MTPEDAFLGALKAGGAFHAGPISVGIHYLWMKLPETPVKQHRLGFVMRMSFIKRSYKIKNYHLPYEIKTN
jgi:hypothetical protein